MAQGKTRIGSLDYLTLLDGVSLADDGTQTLSLSGIKNGLIFVQYKTAAGAYYSAQYALYMSNDTLALLIQDNSTDFDDADTDAKFDLYVNSGTVTLKNRTGATVTAYVTAILKD